MTLFSKPSLIILLGGLMMASLDVASMNAETSVSHDPRALASFIPTPADLEARNFFAAAQAVRDPATKDAALSVLVGMMENPESSIVLRESVIRCIVRYGRPPEIMNAYLTVLETPELFQGIEDMPTRGAIAPSLPEEIAQYLKEQANEFYFWLSEYDTGEGSMNTNFLWFLKDFETTSPAFWLRDQAFLTDWRVNHYGRRNKVQVHPVIKNGKRRLF